MCPKGLNFGSKALLAVATLNRSSSLNGNSDKSVPVSQHGQGANDGAVAYEIACIRIRNMCTKARSRMASRHRELLPDIPIVPAARSVA